MYAYGQFPPTKYFTENLSWYTQYDNFERVIQKADPDVVVSVHPLCQHIPLPIVKKMNEKRASSRLPISFLTVVTDLGGAHSTWFDKRCDFCFIPSKAVYEIARRNKISPNKLVMHGLPIRPAFWKAGMSKEKIRKRLGLENSKTALLMGGGDGVGNLMKIATTLASKLKEYAGKTQVVVVCGHNKRLVEQLEKKSKSLAWPQNVNLVVKGFMTNIDEFMSGSDCLVTKAGPGTIAEAMTRGLPLVLSSFLPGQVKPNI
jgi:1,2-diacylglycerol 3-beta-galactosyltransferase